MNKCIASLFIMVLALAVACKNKTKEEKLATYISKEQNGLLKKISGDNIEIASQLIPEENKSPVFKFMVYVTAKPEKTTDSVLYFFNYRSADYFRLLAGSDTIRPALSERIANGRRDQHQFTVVFDLAANPQPAHDSFSLLFYGNKLFSDSLEFHYTYKDLKKATKTLYGYE